MTNLRDYIGVDSNFRLGRLSFCPNFAKQFSFVAQQIFS